MAIKDKRVKKADIDKTEDVKKKGKKRKVWRIIIAIFLVIIVALGITAGVIIKKLSDLNNGGGGDEPIVEGEITSIGTFLSSTQGEYVLCEYKEYFSEKNIVILQKTSEVLYNYKAYYFFVSENGNFHYNLGGEYTGEKMPETVKAELLQDVKTRFQYSEENIAKCSVNLYTPVAFTRVEISEVTVEDNGVVIKYRAGAVNGELSEEYTLSGTCGKVDNTHTFTYPNLPDNEHLVHVANKLLGSAEYNYYASSGVWVNELTFGEVYKLSFTTAEE